MLTACMTVIATITHNAASASSAMSSRLVQTIQAAAAVEASNHKIEETLRLLLLYGSLSRSVKPRAGR